MEKDNAAAAVNTGMTMASGVLLAKVEEWKRKTHEFSLRSNDPLVPVLSKGFDAMYKIMKGSEHCHIERALGSLDMERIHSLRFETSGESSVRSITYGAMETAHSALTHLIEENKQLRNIINRSSVEISTQTDIESVQVQKPIKKELKTNGYMDRGMVEDQEITTYVSDKIVKEEPNDEMEMPQLDDYSRKGDAPNEQLKVFLNGMPRSKNAVSNLAMEAENEMSGNISRKSQSMEDSDAEDEPIMKKTKSESAKGHGRGLMLKKVGNRFHSTPHCIRCLKYPKTAYAFAYHLKHKHNSSLKSCEIYLECSCGAEIRTESRNADHSAECDGKNYALRKIIQSIGQKDSKCIQCQTYPTTAYGYAGHLQRVHKTSLIASGIYLVCSCGLEIRSANRDPSHSKACAGIQYTIHKVKGKMDPIPLPIMDKTIPSTLQCIMCDEIPATSHAYAAHLRNAHDCDLKQNGIYLLCSCGIKIQSERCDPHQSKKCDGRQFSLHNTADD